MSRKLIPGSHWSYPNLRFPFSLFEDHEEEGWLQSFSDSSGLSVSEDENHIYVEAAIPGIKPEEAEITFDKGVLWIRGEKKEESSDRNKKYYRKATTSFSYRVAVPGNVDEAQQPEATYKHGMLKVTFQKTKKSEPKKISIKPTNN